MLRSSELEIEVDLEALARRSLQEGGNDGHEEQRGNHLVALKCSFTLARRRGELRLVLPGFPIVDSESTSSLLKAIVTAHGWRERIIAGEIYSIEQLAAEANLSPRYASRILRIAALSPDVVDAAIRERSWRISHWATSSFACRLIGKFNGPWLMSFLELAQVPQRNAA